MGAWGYHLLENDPALDIQQLWNEMMGDPQYDHLDVTNRCLARWGDATGYGDTITNMEILALLALHMDNDLKPSSDLVKVAIDAINRELPAEELALWEEPERRREVLIGLLRKLGGREKPPRKPSVLKDPALCYKNASHARTELLKIVKDAKRKPWITYSVMRQIEHPGVSVKKVKIPPFLQTLDRYMKHRIWEKDSSISDQARIERLMMLATYLGISLRMSREEIEQLLDRCKTWQTAVRASDA
jgi:hypothetical protein